MSVCDRRFPPASVEEPAVYAASGRRFRSWNFEAEWNDGGYLCSNFARSVFRNLASLNFVLISLSKAERESYAWLLPGSSSNSSPPPHQHVLRRHRLARIGGNPRGGIEGTQFAQGFSVHVFAALCPQLRPQGIAGRKSYNLSKSDRGGNARRISAKLNKGWGCLAKNRNLAVANRATKQMRDFLTEFRMTPSSRSRVSSRLPPVRNEKVEKFFGWGSGC